MVNKIDKLPDGEIPMGISTLSDMFQSVSFYPFVVDVRCFFKFCFFFGRSLFFSVVRSFFLFFFSPCFSPLWRLSRFDWKKSGWL